jgi:hypothetical protein
VGCSLDDSITTANYGRRPDILRLPPLPGFLQGVIHSPLPDEQIGLPWNIIKEVGKPFAVAIETQTPYHWTIVYILMAVMLVGSDVVRRGEDWKKLRDDSSRITEKRLLSGQG